ncbi:MAG: glycosyltransferase family 2 protein [Gemmatimonadota bacterium]|nr:glycosyltransferase family 2 protein [Gemmatimonadota bacterium]
MRSLLLAGFWISAGALLWIYAGYPLLLLILRRLRPAPIRRREIRPEVTVVVPAHDEEEVIGRKIEDTLALEWPAERLEVLVVSDGSTDATGAIADSWPDERVRLLALERVGKATAMNAGAADATGEVLVFTDANTRLSPDSLVRLVECLGDPAVGAACGRKTIRPGDADGAGVGEGLYWRLEDRLKRLESDTGSVFAADGGLYAIRRELYVPIEDPAQADDIAVSARVVLQGRRLVYEPRAVAVEDAPAEGEAGELRRRIRVTNHSVRALLALGSGVWTRGFYPVKLISHKLLRHFTPFFLALLLVTSLALAPGSAIYAAATGAQLAFYALAALGFASRRTRVGRAAPLSAPYWFCLASAAALVGILSVLAGRRIRLWTPRGGAAAEPSDPGPQHGGRP